MLCLLAGWVIIGSLTLIGWRRERTRLELWVWSLGFSIGAVGVLLLALRGIAPALWSIGFGNALVSIGVGYVWQGFRAFDGRRVFHVPVVMTGVLWMAAYLGSPAFAADINARIVLSSLLLGIQLGWLTYDIWSGYRQEPLPTRPVLAVLIGIYALLNLCRVPLSFIFPVQEMGSTTGSIWYGLLTFLLHIVSLLSGIGIFSLSRERVMLQYKIASETDALTGILNRRAFMKRLEHELPRGGFLVLMDVDHFKKINDTFGHMGGDTVLAGLTSHVRSQLPPDTNFCRFGGEEFALFLKDCSRQTAWEFCENLRLSLEQTVFRWQDKTIRATVSIGVRRAASGGADMEAVVLGADRALYAAKNAGRNRVVLCDDRPLDDMHLDNQASSSFVADVALETDKHVA